MIKDFNDVDEQLLDAAFKMMQKAQKCFAEDDYGTAELYQADFQLLVDTRKSLRKCLALCVAKGLHEE